MLYILADLVHFCKNHNHYEKVHLLAELPDGSSL
jgi:hypothetical protein